MASREASFRVTFVVAVAVSVCGSSSLFHFLQILAHGTIAAEIEIMVCRLKAKMGCGGARVWLVQQEGTPIQLLNDDKQMRRGKFHARCVEGRIMLM